MRAAMRVVALSIMATSIVSVLVAGPIGASGVRGSPPYEQPIWFQWDRAELDVLVVPPNHGQLVNEHGPLAGGDPAELTPTNSYLRAMKRSIASYRTAIERFGPRWLRTGLKMKVYVLGQDTIPEEALSEPEILVVTDESKSSTLGVAFNVRPCIVNNSKMMVNSFTYNDMYNIMGQEFGHCLGLDHVAGGRPRDEVLAHDVLNAIYPHTPGEKANPKHCLSNMNVRGLEVVFGDALSRAIPLESAFVRPGAYRRIDCRRG